MINFDPTSIQNLRSELAAAHAAIEAKYGVKIQLGRGKFTSEMVEFAMTVGNVNTDGTAVNRKYVALKTNLRGLGLAEADLDKVIILSGMRVKIVGYDARRRLRPFFVRNVDTGVEYCSGKLNVSSALSKWVKPVTNISL